jgi:hypothetical protein
MVVRENLFEVSFEQKSERDEGVIHVTSIPGRGKVIWKKNKDELW